MDFWTKFEQLLKNHHDATRVKVETGEAFNELVNGKKMGKETPETDINILLTLKQINEATALEAKQYFAEIMNQAIKYAYETNINFQQLEDEFRKRKLGIYIIAKPSSPQIINDKKAISLYNKVEQPYETNFVVTTDYDYYLKELKYFGYNSKNTNYKNLLKTGVMTIIDS
jgi:hypothetical protein